MFYILLLEQNNTRTKQIGENFIALDFKTSDSNKYQVEVISNSMVYAKELKIDYLPKIYYFIF